MPTERLRPCPLGGHTRVRGRSSPSGQYETPPTDAIAMVAVFAAGGAIEVGRCDRSRVGGCGCRGHRDSRGRPGRHGTRADRTIAVGGAITVAVRQWLRLRLRLTRSWRWSRVTPATNYPAPLRAAITASSDCGRRLRIPAGSGRRRSCSGSIRSTVRRFRRSRPRCPCTTPLRDRPAWRRHSPRQPGRTSSPR